VTVADEAELAAEAGRLQERDEVDSSRPVAPLLRATDAVEVDTTTLEFSAQVAEIVRLARSRGG
jgi:cytidylate kinase